MQDLTSLTQSTAKRTVHVSNAATSVDSHGQVRLILRSRRTARRTVLKTVPSLLVQIGSGNRVLSLVSNKRVALCNPVTPSGHRSVCANFPGPLTSRQFCCVRRTLRAKRQRHCSRILRVSQRLHRRRSHVIPVGSRRILVVIHSVARHGHTRTDRTRLGRGLGRLGTRLGHVTAISNLARVTGHHDFSRTLSHR